jgi:flagellar hook-length control protein FliK
MTTINLLVESATGGSSAMEKGAKGTGAEGDFTASLNTAHGRAAEGALHGTASAVAIDAARGDHGVQGDAGCHVPRERGGAGLPDRDSREDRTKAAHAKLDKKGEHDALDARGYALLALLDPLPATSASRGNGMRSGHLADSAQFAKTGAHAGLADQAKPDMAPGRTVHTPPPASDLIGSASAAAPKAHGSVTDRGIRTPEPKWLDQLKAAITPRPDMPDSAAPAKADRNALLQVQSAKQGTAQTPADVHFAAHGNPQTGTPNPGSNYFIDQMAAVHRSGSRPAGDVIHNDDRGAPAAGGLAAIAPNHPGSMQVGSASAASPTLALAPPIGSVPWQQELGQQMIRMLQRGAHHVELQLHPQELGPLSISLHVDHHGAQAQFLAAHADVREALQQAIPQLREALANHGIALGEAMVGQQQQQQAQQQHDMPASPEPLSVQSVANSAAHATATADAGHAARPHSPRSGLDLYA